MKFKKVEIQAFRAYDKVEDGTFDFTTGVDECADFIAIYAPNGFGKTSFYDAVEWGVTQNIHRLVQKKFSLDQAKSEKNENAATKHYVLRNRYSAPGVKSFVKLYTTNPNINGFELKEPRKGQSDFGFVKTKSSFQEVVLSQEWIDAFLREDEPQARYQTFIDYFGDKELDDYYRSIIALLNANDDNIKVIEDALKGLQLDLKYDGDREILKTTNGLINELKAKGEQISEIDILFTTSDALKIGHTIIQRTAALDTAIFNASRQIMAVETAFSGNVELIGLEEFHKIKTLIAGLEKEIKEFQRLIERYRGLGELQNQILSIEKLQAEKISQRDALNVVFEQFKTYQSINQQIGNLLADQEQFKSKIAQARSDDDGCKKDLADLTAKRQALYNRLGSLTSRLEAFPQIRIDWNSNDENNKETSEAINNLKDPIDKARIQVKTIEDANNLLNQYKLGIGRDIEKLEILLKTQYEAAGRAIEAKINSVRELDEQISVINKSIKANEDLNKDIQNLANKGLDIINKKLEASCPLCTTEFKTHQELVDRVVNNKLLSNQLQQLLATKSALEEQKVGSESAIDKLVNDLTREISNRIDDNTAPLADAKQALATLLDLQKELEGRLASIKRQEDQLNARCPRIDIDTEEQKTKDEITRINSEIEDTNKKRTENEEKQIEISRQIHSQATLLEQNDKQIQEYRENVTYKTILAYFNQNYPRRPITIDILNAQINSIEDELTGLIKRKSATTTAIEQVQVELASKNKELMENDLAKANTALDENKKKVTAFEQNIISSFSLGTDISKIELNTFLNNLRENLKKEIEDNEKRVAQFNLLRQLIDDVEPFLKFEKAKASQEISNERLQYLKTTVRPTLEAEKKNVSDHLDQMVNSFFYEDVINDLYRKIDPHPDYKKIKFKCDFNEDKPTLNIFVTDDEDKMKLIPNLYFSTAQLNILSLSIFLAKALNAKDDDGVAMDCIFIDDPIQSMDSINILSTIDLIRSIVFNQGKQVILSTHDDNFFNLLQKKIPPGKFKSKYIELETFGKVKREAAVDQT